LRNPKQYFLVALTSLLLSVVSFAVEEPTTEIPFKLSQNYLIVTQGSIGPLENLNFIIDSGAIPSMIDQRIAKKLELATDDRQLVAFGGQKVQVKGAVLPDLRLGPIRAQSFPVAVGDLSFLVGTRIDAIIGLDVLKFSSFQIDYESQRISFRPIKPSEAVTGFREVWPFLIVQMEVQDRPVHLLVDTGSRDLILFQSRLQDRLPKMITRGDKVIYHSSGESHLKKVLLPSSSLGQTKWKLLTAYLLDTATDAYPSDVDGVLGVLSLGVKRIRFDFERNTLSWDR
jgi:hypothetical protein